MGSLEECLVRLFNVETLNHIEINSKPKMINSLKFVTPIATGKFYVLVVSTMHMLVRLSKRDVLNIPSILSAYDFHIYAVEDLDTALTVLFAC